MRSNFVFQEIWVGLRRNLTMTVALIVVVAISLSLLGTGLLFVKQVDSTRTYWQSKVEISVYLCYADSANPNCHGAVTTAQTQALQQLVGQKVQQDNLKSLFTTAHDYQQNFLIDGVKVNIFTPNADLAGMVEPSSAPLVHVASVPELFRTKALAAANRSVSRDWIDLYVLFKQHDFSLADFHNAFQQSGIPDPAQRIARAFQNLCRCVMSATDPGYETLFSDSPPLSDLAEFFTAMRNEYEIQMAREGFRGR